MDDPFPIPPEAPSGTPAEQFSLTPGKPAPEPIPQPKPEPLPEPPPEPLPNPMDTVNLEPALLLPSAGVRWMRPPDPAPRRELLHSLFLLLGLTLTAFTLTAWILVRVQSPFDLFSTGPQQVVRAQLRALDRGELQAAYELFSDRFRKQVTFNEWHQLIVTHWRMFHVEILDAGQLAQSGSRATLEMHVRGADDKSYRARFTLIRVAGRWWVDDLHWSNDEDEGTTFRT